MMFLCGSFLLMLFLCGSFLLVMFLCGFFLLMMFLCAEQEARVAAEAAEGGGARGREAEEQAGRLRQQVSTVT